MLHNRIYYVYHQSTFDLILVRYIRFCSSKDSTSKQLIFTINLQQYDISWPDVMGHSNRWTNIRPPKVFKHEYPQMDLHNIWNIINRIWSLFWIPMD